jgi:hypothetical protein
MAGLNLFTNNAATTLASSINSSVTSLTVAAGTGGLFPSLAGSQYFYCTLANTAGTTIEIVKVTARSTDTFTIIRGQDNTTAAAFAAGDKVELRLVDASLENFPQLDSTNTFSQAQTFSAGITSTATPIGVASGGTGASSQTAYAVLTGGTTSTGAYQSVASLGTSGQVLMSNGAGALPTFQTVSTKAFPTGTRMSFQQTAAPTGWTKDTTAAINNSALRFVTGSVVNGGTVDFTTAFASQTPAGSVAISAISGSAGATTLITSQIPSHTHTFGSGSSNPGPSGKGQNYATFNSAGTTSSAGGDGSHTHPFTFSSGTAAFTGTAINLAVKYYDFIIASID